PRWALSRSIRIIPPRQRGHRNSAPVLRAESLANWLMGGERDKTSRINTQVTPARGISTSLSYPPVCRMMAFPAAEHSTLRVTADNERTSRSAVMGDHQPSRSFTGKKSFECANCSIFTVQKRFSVIECFSQPINLSMMLARGDKWQLT
ncbi:MAG TPA: hypothetical protein VHP14_24800, partial [Anaerolineales bacterium]|nr:hypothetical protein [Anaerolineales bacterium]